ncbi:MAG: glycosyltransferase family 39 protein [Desulfarculus sp.]|nr:glycosyltransferase family 39 protein [Desulfarculus sp.]
MSPAGQRYWLLVVLAVLAAAAALYLVDLGQMPLTDRDEGEYAASVGAMFRGGDFMVPTLNGQHYLEKPILTFWLIAGAQALLGPGELAARLPSAVAALALLLWLGYLALVVSRGPAFTALTLAAAAFTPLMALVGRASLTDMPLTLFTTLSLGAFFLANERQAPADRPWWWLAWAGLGLGFLTKGPVALAVVLPSALVYALIQGRFLHCLRRGQWLWGPLIFLVINLPWYGLAFWRLGDEFWRAFFLSQNLRRFSEVLLGHGGGLFYYLPVLLLGFWPFGAAGLPALGAALAKNPRAARQADPLARLRLLAAVTVLVVLVVFSLAATKQINYILPAWPWLGLLAGYQLWRWLAGEDGGRFSRGVRQALHLGLGGLWALVLLALPAGLHLAWPRIQASIRPDSSEYALPDQAPLIILWPLALGLAALAVVWLPNWLRRRGRGREAVLALCLGGALFCGGLMLGLLPRAAQEIQQPAKDLALEVGRGLGGAAKVVSFGLWKPSMLFYLDREIPRLRTSEADQLARELAQEAPLAVLSRASLAPTLAAVPGFVELGRWSGYLLGGNAAAQARWQGSTPAAQPAAPPSAESEPAPPAAAKQPGEEGQANQRPVSEPSTLEGGLPSSPEPPSDGTRP